MSGLREAVRPSRLVWVALALAVGACGGGSEALSSEDPLPPGDSLAPPTSAPPPPPDTSTPSPPPPVGPPTYTGIPFGPNVYTKHESSASLIPPSSLSPAFTALVTAAYPATLLAKLEAARRTNGRVLLSFAGISASQHDSAGFNL